MQYPTAEVDLQTGLWRKRVWVAVAPHLSVDVLLETDIFCLDKHSLAVVTRSQSRRASITGAEGGSQANKGIRRSNKGIRRYQ